MRISGLLFKCACGGHQIDCECLVFKSGSARLTAEIAMRPMGFGGASVTDDLMQILIANLFMAV